MSVALLRKYGEALTVYDAPPAVSDDEFDPVTGEPIASQLPEGVAAFGYLGRYTARDVDGTNIRKDDGRLVLQVLATRPTVGQYVIIDSITWRFMDVQTVRKSGVDQIYICQVRRS